MKTNSLLFLVSLFYFLSLLFPSLSERCNPEDKKVLLQIKQDLNNQYTFTSWNPENDCCDDWLMIECDAKTNRVIVLGIVKTNLTGQIPASVGDLPFLETLIFQKLPNLTGQIPSAIAKLTNLKYLWLSWTNLTGPVPSFVGKLKALTYVNLSFNKLSGTIPPSLSLLPNLGALFLDRNQLTGSIPESFGRFVGVSAPALYLSHNQLTGHVPKSLGGMNFSTIDLSWNRLQGDIFFLFGKNKTLEFAYFSRNMFEFDISKVEVPNGLYDLDVSHNRVRGSVPVGLTSSALERFRSLNVSYNRLCGEIPVGGILQSFTKYEYFHNRCLCGAPLPAC